MKNLTTALRDGNLRPKERVLLLVQSDVAKDKTGNEILTEADKHALNEGWRPDNSDQSREFNRYIEGWRLMNNAEINAQTTYLGATNALLRACRLIDMAVSKDGASAIDFCRKTTESYTPTCEGNPLDLVLQNSGMELKQVIHRYAFESLSEDMKKDILSLNPDGKTESQYLDQEEIIADAFNDKSKLTTEAKEKLADSIVKSMYNKYANIFTNLGTKDEEMRGEYFFSGYYGELPAIEILNKWAVYNNQLPKKEEDLLQHISEDKEYENESEEVADLFLAIRKELNPKIIAYAQKHQTSVGELLKQTLLKWLDNGLFTKDFTPIWNSEGKNTYIGVDTKLPHKDVLKEWLKAKRKSEQTIQGLIDTGELKVEERVETLKRFNRNVKGVEKCDEDDFKKTLTLITGESLYNLTGDFAFASDYRKQADDLEGLGGVVLFLRERNFMNEYSVLLSFVELFKRLSKVYEIDLTYKIMSWLANFKDDIEMLNREILILGDKLQQATYEKHDAAFLVEMLVENMLIDPDEVKPDRGRTGKYFVELEKTLGAEFGSYEDHEINKLDL